MEEAMESVEEWIQIRGYRLNDLRFADDQGMDASIDKEFQRTMDGPNEIVKK